MNYKYYWSLNQYAETWHHHGATIEDCIEQARKYDSDKTVVYIGEAGKYIPYVDADHILDNAYEQAWDEVGEGADTWLHKLDRDIVDELSDKLSCTFHEWLEQHDLIPRFGILTNVRDFDLLTGEEIEEEI